ncbi:hypothetical protein HJFPF1_10354 [Paramyrothecium foliicola]|nr:hypothetical protein HJFPF1_10354 [Paramyrothecium foliicola]
MDAQAFLRDPRFNRSVELQIGGQRSLHVKYADFGYQNEASGGDNVLLFLGPMFGSRMLHVFKDDLAKQHQVRFICIDRPGFGGTDAVGIAERLEVSRDIIISLLQHLGISHVALACQSGGTVYALDLILHHPEILQPAAPYLAIGAPWIHPSHTGVFLMNVTSSLPVAAIGSIDKLATFFQTTVNPIVGPVTGFSLGVSQFLSGVGAAPAGEAGQDEGSQIEAELFPKMIEYAHSESIEGMSDEAILLMKRVDGTDGWGDWSDYDTLLPRLATALQTTGRQLSVDIYFGEKDSMIGDAGTKGTVWLEKCFQDAGMAVESHVVTGADHNTVWDLKFGVAAKVFAKIGR